MSDLRPTVSNFWHIKKKKKIANFLWLKFSYVTSTKHILYEKYFLFLENEDLINHKTFLENIYFWFHVALIPFGEAWI